MFLRALGPFSPEFESRLTQYILALNIGETNSELWLDVLDQALTQASDGHVCWIENGEALREFSCGATAVDRVIGKGKRVLLCTRESLTLPSALRAPPNEHYFVGIDDLRFTDAESETLFPGDADRKLVRRALDIAKGWPNCRLDLRSRRPRRETSSRIVAGRRFGIGLVSVTSISSRKLYRAYRPSRRSSFPRSHNYTTARKKTPERSARTMRSLSES